LLAKPTQLNINLSSDRFAMFNKQRDITEAAWPGKTPAWSAIPDQVIRCI
jgi:hypothetical protein